MHRITFVPFLAIALACEGNAQQGPTGTPLPACEWCGAAEAPAGLSSEITIAPHTERGERLTLSGVVYRADGRTPVPDVLVYAYHTNADGIYPKRGNETGNARRHGYLRGWLRTDASGRYTIHTIRPAPYPGRTEAAHIHLTVTPPGGAEDYVDAVEFDDDPLLTPAERARRTGRGGPGIVGAKRGAGGWTAVRDVVLAQGEGKGEGPVPWAEGGRAEGVRAGGGIAVMLVGGVKAVDTLVVDASASVVRWKGTKFRGLGKHEGELRLGGGLFVVRDGAVASGSFSMDMRTIQVTDIPVTDPVPRNRLTNHLKDEDFFWVERHPSSTFVLRTVQRSRDGLYRVAGVLTLRGVSRPVSFDAMVSGCGGGQMRVTSSFEINRHDWGISFRGSRLTNDLVDDDIALELDIVARTRSGTSSSAIGQICNNSGAAGIRS